MRVLRIVVINIVVIVVLLIVFFVVLEVGSRIYLNRFASDETFMRYASYRQLQKRGIDCDQTLSPVVAHRYLGFIPRPNFVDGLNRHNSLGYRGEEFQVPKPASEFRIVCIGASTTYTSSVNDYRESYPAQLQAILRDRGYNVTVVNAGCTNWMTYESLINFQFRVLDLEPDLIIVYHAVNDLLGRLVWPHSAYAGDNSGVRQAPITQWFMPNIIEYSTLFRTLLVRSGRQAPHSAGFATLNKLRPSYVGEILKHQHAAGEYPSGLFAEHPVSEILSVNPPIFFKRNLVTIVAIALQNDIVPVLATFAHSPEFPKSAWSSCNELALGYEEMNTVIKEVAASENAICFDFAAQFPTSSEYYTDGIHVNAKGARLKAKFFADFLVREGLLPAE